MKVLSTRWRRLAAVLTVALSGVAGSAAAQEQKPAELWEDFLHYVRIARPDLAQNAADALMGVVSDQELLDIIENSPRASQAYPTLDLAEKIESLKPTAIKIRQRIENANIQRARDPGEIRKNILALMQGRRARINATARLKAAGQFAVPHMLKYLEDDDQSELHPFLLPTFVAIGRDVVYPLSVALPSLRARPQIQVAQVLTELGYPISIPYFRRVMDNPQGDPNAKAAVASGYAQLARNTGAGAETPASDLFLALSRQHYASGTRGDLLGGYDEFTKTGMLWKYGSDIGLVPVPVPGPVYADARARECAEEALTLNKQLTAAHSAWLAASLRGQNRLPAEQQDKGYRNPRAPEFHARLAGPERLHDVLQQALQDADSELARDAIAALRQTSGTAALVNAKGLYQPLLAALSYPDRRVRFEAADALTQARPSEPFPQSFRVVPVLAEAVRQTAKRYAVVLGRDENSRNRLASVTKALGYVPLPGLSIEEVSEQVTNSPGVDLVVVDLDVQGIEDVMAKSASDYQLAAIPVVAIVSRAAAIELTRRYPDQRRLYAVQAAAAEDDEKLKRAVEDAAKVYAGQPITPEEATKYATISLTLLREVAISGTTKVYNVGDAQPALLAALSDERDAIVTLSGEVLALLPTDVAQQALADAALDPARLADVRVALLTSAAKSVKAFGSKLNEAQVRRVIELVKTAEGDLATSAANLHGALMPPTVSVVDLIVSQER